MVKCSTHATKPMYVDVPVSGDNGVFVPCPHVPLNVLLPNERMEWRSPSRPQMPLKVSPPSGRKQRRRNQRLGMAANETCKQRRRSQSLGAAPNTGCAEETWQNRMMHREEGVRAIKRTPEYIAATCAHVQRPRTPNPTDRTLSKRAWERSVQVWRKSLKEVGAADSAVQ